MIERKVIGEYSKKDKLWSYRISFRDKKKGRYGIVVSDNKYRSEKSSISAGTRAIYKVFV